MKRWDKNRLILLAIVALVFFNARFASAGDEQVSIGLTESLINLELERGESKTIQIGVVNPSKNSLKVKVGFEDFAIVDSKNTTRFLPEGNELFGISQWLKTGKEFLELPPGGSYPVPIEISAPQDAGVGSHYGAVYFETIPEITGENFNQVIINGRVVTLVLINIKGELSGNGEIKLFETPRFLDTRVPFKLNFSNEGNFHYIPHGEVKLVNLFGREVGKADVEKHFVFPGKDYFFEGTLDAGKLLGVYKVKAEVVDGNRNTHIRESWVVGKKLAWVVLIIMVFLGMVGWIIKTKRRNNKQDTRDKIQTISK